MQSSLTHNSTPPAHQELYALQQLLAMAQQYFQQQAQQSQSGNLRRQFQQLQQLHQQVLLLLPATEPAANADDQRLATLQQFYQNSSTEICSPACLSQLKLQLNKQLHWQKTLLRSQQLGCCHTVLLHFTASLQMATDQLTLRLHH